jgi:heme/copper-type cytochrome/quinol oxidase subunit 2
MTLYTTDYLEYYLTLVAWVVNNGIWSILVASGVFALPFVAIVIQEWLKARSEGADEGNKGVLSSMRIENRVWVAIVVIMFAGILEPPAIHSPGDPNPRNLAMPDPTSGPGVPRKLSVQRVS